MVLHVNSVASSLSILNWFPSLVLAMKNNSQLYSAFLAKIGVSCGVVIKLYFQATIADYHSKLEFFLSALTVCIHWT